jgi:uncharacterized membrane protein
MQGSGVQGGRAIQTGWTAAVALTLLVVILATLPPFVPEFFRAILMVAFDPVCHQMPDRSFLVHGEQFAVCHRCYGTFVGLLIGSVLFPLAGMWDGVLYRRAGVVLLIALVIPGADWMGGIAGLWSNTALSRSVTGSVFGLVAGYYFARALAQAFPTKPSSPTSLALRPSTTAALAVDCPSDNGGQGHGGDDSTVGGGVGTAA